MQTCKVLDADLSSCKFNKRKSDDDDDDDDDDEEEEEDFRQQAKN